MPRTVAPPFFHVVQINSWENQLRLRNIHRMKIITGALAVYGESSLHNGVLWLWLSKDSGLRRSSFMAFFRLPSRRSISVLQIIIVTTTTTITIIITIIRALSFVSVICYCYSKNIWGGLLFNCSLWQLFRQRHPFCFSCQNLRVYWNFVGWLHLGFLLWKYPVAQHSKDIIMLFLRYSHPEEQPVSKPTASLIGEFQWEVQLGVYFSPGCRPTRVHLLMSTSLGSSSQTKLKNSDFQGLLKKQVPPFLTNSLLVCVVGFAELRAPLLPSVAFRVKLLSSLFSSFLWLQCSKQGKQPRCYCHHLQH